MKYNDNGLWKDINIKVTDTLPIGTIIPFAGTTLPANYMLCDGAALSRTEYASLYAAIGTAFGSGDGSTTFNLPNIKGRVLVGQDTDDTSFDAIGETGGEKAHTLTTTEMPSHQHSLQNANAGGSTVSWTNYGVDQTSNKGFTDNVKTDFKGGNQAHNNLQPYIVVKYIIKVLDAPASGIRSETLPVGSEIDYDGETIPTGWEEVEETILRKELTADAAGNAGVNWQNLGDLYLDLTPGTWYVKANAYIISTGVGIGYNKSCLSLVNTGGSINDRLDSMSDMFPSNLGVDSASVHSLSCVISVSTTTRIYLLEAFAYTGSNTSIKLKYDTNVVTPGLSFIEAKKLY